MLRPPLRPRLRPTPPARFKNYSIALTRTDGMMKALVDAGQSAKTLYNDSKKLFNASEAVPGIGDEAVIVKSSIYALKGDVFVIASTIFGTSPEAKAALRSLTEKAVGKL